MPSTLMEKEIRSLLAIAVDEEVPPIYKAYNDKLYILVEEGGYYRIIINNLSDSELKVDINTGSGQKRRDFIISPGRVVEIASDAYAHHLRFMPAKERNIKIKLEFNAPDAPQIPELVINYLNAAVPEEAEAVKAMEMRPGCIALGTIRPVALIPDPQTDGTTTGNTPDPKGMN